MNPTCFVDDDKKLHGTLIGNLKVLTRKELLRRIQKGKKVDEVLSAIPSASRMKLKSLLEEIEEHIELEIENPSRSIRISTRKNIG